MNSVLRKKSGKEVLVEGYDKLPLHRFLVCLIVISSSISLPARAATGQLNAAVKLSNPDIRQQAAKQLAEKSRQRKTAAWEIANLGGWIPKEQINSTTFELMAIEGDRVYVYKTCNVDAAISIAANLIRNTPPYYLNGAGLTIGVWDSGAVRPTHQEFGGRVSVMDGAANANHSTHVGGTIAAAGVVADALGMAPSVLVDSYNWTDDVSETTSRAMSYPNEPGKIQASNHSYGYVCGWEHSYSPPRWYGTWGNRESEFFGQYDSEVAQWDQLCYNAPYYLPFRAAGNDRNDDAPPEGDTFEYYSFPKWREKTYDPCTDPYSDGWDNGGFDTIMLGSTAKNIMTVGAVNDAVTAGVRDISKGTITAFSGWGPTDDGRIKPDIVTNGTTLYSSTAASNTSYATYSGTSMATPGAAGASMLLLDYYDRLFPAQAMRASTLKALIIHTADDIGSPGPDYKFGWGLMNAEAAAKNIKDHNDFPYANNIVEDIVNNVTTTQIYTCEFGTGGPIKATLCWTDPPAAAAAGLDNNSPRLVNDLDLRIIGPGGSPTYYPFVLNPAAPNTPAATGDNIIDNIEQVLIHTPAAPGTCSIQVSCKGTLTDGQQYFSLIISGYSPTDFNGDGLVDFLDLAELADSWLLDNPLIDIAPPLGDGIINFLDFAKFAQSWN